MQPTNSGYGSAAPMRTRMTNDARVFKVMSDARRPMTIAELSRELPDIVEKTVRRAVDSLRRNGFIIEAGRDNNSKLYAIAGMMGSNAGDRLIPMGNDVITVADFVKLMAGMEQKPFATRLKTELLSDAFQQIMRQRMLFTIVSAGEAGYNSQLLTVQEALVKVVEEMERLTNMMRSFVNSSVWYEHYRDPIAQAMRDLQKKDPELWQLAWDFVKSGSSTEK